MACCIAWRWFATCIWGERGRGGDQREGEGHRRRGEEEGIRGRGRGRSRRGEEEGIRGRGRVTGEEGKRRGSEGGEEVAVGEGKRRGSEGGGGSQEKRGRGGDQREGKRRGSEGRVTGGEWITGEEGSRLECNGKELFIERWW